MVLSIQPGTRNDWDIMIQEDRDFFVAAPIILRRRPILTFMSKLRHKQKKHTKVFLYSKLICTERSRLETNFIQNLKYKLLILTHLICIHNRPLSVWLSRTILQIIRKLAFFHETDNIRVNLAALCTSYKSNYSQKARQNISCISQQHPYLHWCASGVRNTTD